MCLLNSLESVINTVLVSPVSSEGSQNGDCGLVIGKSSI